MEWLTAVIALLGVLGTLAGVIIAQRTAAATQREAIVAEQQRSEQAIAAEQRRSEQAIAAEQKRAEQAIAAEERKAQNAERSRQWEERRVACSAFLSACWVAATGRGPMSDAQDREKATSLLASLELLMSEATVERARDVWDATFVMGSDFGRSRDAFVSAVKQELTLDVETPRP
jgi:hypothetical protein